MRMDRLKEKYQKLFEAAKEKNKTLQELDFLKEQSIIVQSRIAASPNLSSMRDLKATMDGLMLQNLNMERLFLEKKMKEMESDNNHDDPGIIAADINGYNEKVSTASSLRYFHELGILDDLRKKKTGTGISNEGLAVILQKMIGGQIATIKRALNAIDSQEVSSSKNPLQNEKAMEAVRENLRRNGF